MTESEIRRQSARSVTWIGILVNTILIVFKGIAGMIGQSQGLVADAVHSLSDLFTDVVVLVGLKIGSKAPDNTHHFGHARLETLASAVVGMALIATALFLGMKSCMDIYHHREYQPTGLALGAAICSIIFKEALYQYTVYVGRRINNQLIIANAWHHRSDSFSSVAVMLGIGAALLNPAWHIFDAYAALLVSFFVIKVGIDIFRKALDEFTDTSPAPEVIEKICDCVKSVPGVIDMHELRVRTSGGLYQMEVHIVVDGDIPVHQGHRIAKSVEQCLEERLENLDRVILHVDPEQPNR